LRFAMMRKSMIVTLAGGALAANCAVDDSAKVDCGFVGIDQGGCESKGCCWVQSDDAPWCFNAATPTPSSDCFSASTNSTPPFSSDEVAKFTGYFMKNINIDGTGAVVAAPDHNTPGGDYYFHWERDGALTMRALFETQDIASIDDKMKAYVQWVTKTQNQGDPNNQDVRTEPKYTIPDGKPYTGAWCRPQTDGPGLRGITLMMYANHLLDNGETDYVKKYLWTGTGNGGSIKYDLDWVASNWQQEGCDLWEEVRSTDFFWNRITFKLSMQLGADFAARMGDNSTGSKYGATAANIINTLDGHWTGSFITESQNRPQDGAVIVGFNDGYNKQDGFFGPLDAKVAATVSTLTQTVCEQYPINKIDAANGVAGVLLGRYPGDNYAGGNPWILTTGALATLFYRGATELLSNGTVSEEAMVHWGPLLGLEKEAKPETLELSRAFAASGDGVMERIRYHIAGNDFHMMEQIDANSGVQMSAKDLTWSYAEVIKAVHARNTYAKLAKQSFQQLEGDKFFAEM